MKDTVIAVGGCDVGLTPLMPFIGEKFSGRDFTMPTRLRLEAALLRCGFDVADKKQPLTDSQDMILQANRSGADCIVVVSYSAFGSRKSFNDVSGATVKYSFGRLCGRSRELAEDICAKLCCVKKCRTEQSDWAWNGAACPAVIIECGYLTQFDEAKLIYDPDYSTSLAEHAVMGICEYFGLPYIPPDDFGTYADLCTATMGKRGKRIKLLQALIAANGYDVDIDGIYGRDTALAVKTLGINNATDSDCVTAQLIRRLAFTNTQRLTFGSKHCGVLRLQRKLHSKLYKTPLSGTLDCDTITAVNEFLAETQSSITVPQGGDITSEVIDLLSPIGGGRPRLF